MCIRDRACTIVLAGEAYLSKLAPLRHQSIPLYSLIVLTEPLSEAQWAEIGWEQHECVCSARLAVDYLSRTADGRILFGGRGAPYHFGSRIEDDYDHEPAIHEMLRRNLVSWFPVLKGVHFTHAWGGPISVPRDWMPTVGYDRASGVATGRGYIGQGVGTTNLVGRILSDLICGEETSVSRLAFVGHRSPDWEPEPLRWLGLAAGLQVMAGADAREARTGRPDRWAGAFGRLLGR